MKTWDGKRDVDKYAAPDGGDWQDIVNEVQVTQKVVIDNDRTYSCAIDGGIVSGQPLILESGVLKLASQDSPEVIGVCLGETNYAVQGQLTLEDWSAVTGSITLIPGEYYYLDNQKGKLTPTPPNQIVLVIVGRAQNLNTLDINVQTPVYL